MKDTQKRPFVKKREPVEIPENLSVGRNALRDLLAGAKDIEKIYVAKGDRDGGLIRLLADARARHIPIIQIDKADLDKMAGSSSHQGVVCTTPMEQYSSIEDMFALAESRGEKPLLVICDGVEDPHNLGAIIRSAECAGAHGVIIPKRRSSGLTGVVSKASAGALAYMPVARVTNLVSTIKELKDKGVWIYAADMDGESYSQSDLRGSMALVLGSEGDGVSRLVKENCDFILSIPLYGKVNSLNVSNAAAVLLCEAARQRH